MSSGPPSHAMPAVIPGRGSERWSRALGLVALAGVLLFVLVVRVRLLDIPFERDEGGFAYVGRMMLRGVPLYTELRDTKLPGLYLVYGVIEQLAGATPRGVHLGLLLFNLTGICLLFLLARKLFGNLVASIAAATHALLTLSTGVNGFAAHATQLLLVPALGGLLVLLKAIETRRRALFALSGLLFGVAFAIKQPAMHFALFAATYLLVRRLRARPLDLRALVVEEALLILPALLPFAATAATMALLGRFDAFWFWTFEWPVQYASHAGLADHLTFLPVMAGYVTEGQVPLWALAGLGLLSSPLLLKTRANLLFAYLFACFMAAAVSTGFNYYPHYFVMLAPAASIFAGLLVLGVDETLVAHLRSRALVLVPLAAFGLVAFASARSQPTFAARPDLDGILRHTYGLNPFPEAPLLGRFIRAARQPGDTLAVIGSEPELYLYADCEAATGHLFMYPLVDGGDYDDRLQEEMIREVESSAPRFLVVVHVRASWLASGTPQPIHWAADYAAAHYEVVALADIFTNRTVYRWNAEARAYTPRSRNFVVVYERRRS